MVRFNEIIMFDNVFILHIVITFLLMHIFTRLYTICVFIICSAYSANIIYFSFLTHVTIHVCCDACIYMVYTLVYTHFLVNEFYIYFTQFTNYVYFTNYVHFTTYILNIYFIRILHVSETPRCIYPKKPFESIE